MSSLRNSVTGALIGIAHEGELNRRDVVEVHPPDRASAKLERLQAEPDFFSLVSAAHEFKTPLVVMLGYTDLLRNGQLGQVNTQQGLVLDEMQESARRLQKLIGDLLLLVELKSAGAPKMPDQEFSHVNQELQEIFDYWAPAAERKQLRYELSLIPGDPTVLIDSLKLQHIVSNLIENALKFTPGGGCIRVCVTPCFWERRKEQTQFLFNMERKKNVKVENAVRIDVTDTGPGIPPEHHEDIFGDFVQLPGAAARGTGLGLAIARRLAEAYGGLVWVESEPGKGSKFSLLFAQAREES